MLSDQTTQFEFTLVHYTEYTTLTLYTVLYYIKLKNQDGKTQ